MKRDSLPATEHQLDVQPISRDVLAEKYFKPGETSLDKLYGRVARALASVEKPELRAEWERKFLANLYAGAIGAGRIMSAAGTDIQATLINCFVQPVGDAIQGHDDEGYPGIYEALREAAETMRRGGGVGYDFSRIRPKGAYVKGTASMASGPCSYMNVFDQSCSTVESAGARRGAQMGVLRIDHPDVLEFITAKRTPGRWNNFNVSVGVSDAFMQAVADGSDWELVHKAMPGPKVMDKGAYQRADGQWVYRKLPARELWDTIMKSTYDFAEPGILFLDQIGRDNNLNYTEKIEATNPCVTADTWVMTSEGPAQVAQLIGKTFEAVVDGAAYPVLSRGFFRTGHRPVLELRTVEGHAMRLTCDHKVRRVATRTRYIMRTEWVQAQDLQPGDEVALHNHRTMDGWDGEGTEAEGYLLGLLVGDGVLKADRAVLSVWDERFKSVANGASSPTPTGVMVAALAAAQTLPHRVDFAGWQRPLADRGEVRMASAPLRDLAVRYGMAPGAKGLTPALECTSSAFHAGLLRGLFDSDGSVQGTQSKGVSVRLAQSDLANLQAVQRMLLRMGIASKLHDQRRPSGTRMLPNGQGSQGLYVVAAQHELVISGDNLAEFAERVGFSDEAKADALERALRGYQRRLNRERFVATVEGLTPDGYEDVYDVTVAEVHAFDANGLYVHNCGEQPLPPYGCCDLGPIILTNFVRHPFGAGGDATFDFDAFEQVVATQVRALDNVLDVTFWPLEQQRAESAAKRRIGVGFTGLGNALTMLKLRYDRAEGRDMATQIARRMRDAAYRASVELAKEKGAFPKFKADGYLAKGTFASRLPADIQADIRQHGIRNSHLLSIAPTGTVSLAFADNASNGIEPAFSWGYQRNKREADGSKSAYTVEDHAFRLYRSLIDSQVTPDNAASLPEYFVNALEMTAQEHVAMMQAVQPYVDTSISKTVNIPEDYPYEDFKNLYRQAWEAGLKGLATYRPNSILGAVLETTPAKKEEPAPQPPAGAPMMPPVAYDPMRTVIEKRPSGGLPSVTEKIEYWTHEGQQRLYLIVSFLAVPTADGKGEVERAIEFFMPVGQSGESQQWITATMRMLSLAARGGFLDRALSDMRKVTWDRGPVRLGTYEKADGTHVPRWHDSEVAAIGYAIENLIAQRALAAQGSLFDPDELPAVEPRVEPAAMVSTTVMAGKKCPECGAHAMIRKDGCDYCTQCGYMGSCG